MEMEHEPDESFEGEWKIEPRPGVEVYVTQKGFIAITQLDEPHSNNVVIVHPDDVPQLIELLSEVRDYAPEQVPVAGK